VTIKYYKQQNKVFLHILSVGKESPLCVLVIIAYCKSAMFVLIQIFKSATYSLKLMF